MSKKRNFNHTVCDCTTIHQNVIDSVQTRLPSTESIYDIADFFKILGDSTRIRILSALSHEEMCVCDISALFDMTQSAVSHQLRLLKQARLVKFRKAGKIVYYTLNDEHVRIVLSIGFDHLRERK